MFIVGLGLGQVLKYNPSIISLIRVLCVIYVLWLAWKIARSRPGEAVGKDKETPVITFWQACLLQWVNPKAWAVAMIVTVSYTVNEYYLSSLASSILFFGMINLPSISAWALFGAYFRRLILDPAKVRILNIAMAPLLAATMIPLIMRISV